MAEINLLVLVISLLLYVVLGGADFGGGILELLTKEKLRALFLKPLPRFGRLTTFG